MYRNSDHVILGEFDTSNHCNGDSCVDPRQTIQVASTYRTGLDFGTNDILLIKLKYPATLNGNLIWFIQFLKAVFDKFCVEMVLSDYVTPICLPTGTEEFSVYGEVGKLFAMQKNNFKKFYDWHWHSLYFSWMGCNDCIW